MAEIDLIILVCAGLTLASVFTSVVAFRAGAPLLLLFLCIGLLAGRDGLGGIVLTDRPSAFLIASAALAVILFDSGFHTSLKSYRQAAAPAITLATLGVVLTAGLLALPAHFLLGFDWPVSLLLSTSLSSTDAAALFFLLRVGGITIRDRVRSTLEVESGTNDPVAACLALTLVGVVAGQHGQGLAAVAVDLARQMGGGVLFGLIGGMAMVLVVNRVKLEAGLYPVVVMGLAIAVYAMTNLLGGSGFLAAYLAGLVAGNARLQSAGSLRRFQDGITWLAQIGMFVTLGLLARPSQFPAIALPSALLAAALIFLARPIAVFCCLAPFRFGTRERFFIAWVGLRGAVSLLLALVPVLGGVPGSDVIFEISFLVVLVSLAVQGWTVRPLARWLGLIVPEKTGLVERVEVDLPGLADREMVTYQLHPESAIAHGRPLPRWARPLLLHREGTVQYSPRRLQAGDRIYLLATPSQLPLLDKLFGKMKDEGATEASLYGDFAIGPDATLKALRESYGLPIGEEEETGTIGEIFRREYHSDLEIGDRLHLGPIDLIVRDMQEGRILSVGIALEPEEKPLAGWEKFKARLIAAIGLPEG
ncbi:potassium/proton antiporter [Telmatospirillum siberiense]|uniref:Potassium/proton antiporter n=1 Tax=Telmatospirillum siberiense TaxID=382514 RepID=A0A2N3PPH3_9PROT|nr:potassium/proton antiporter [Telmatospirillum siberiense]PKU22292.1 potassium/proton antiporter [Telmatospirillum siberiense]